MKERLPVGNEATEAMIDSLYSRRRNGEVTFIRFSSRNTHEFLVASTEPSFDPQKIVSLAENLMGENFQGGQIRANELFDFPVVTEERDGKKVVVRIYPSGEYVKEVMRLKMDLFSYFDKGQRLSQEERDLQKRELERRETHFPIATISLARLNELAQAG